MRDISFPGSQTTRILRSRSLTCLLALLCIAPAVFAEQYTWNDVRRIVAISDPHGAYEAMVRTLANADVVDDDRNWSGGDTHLVITGDLLDRGADSRKVMDLVMQLEEQAAAAGGMVHLLLGNHEVMNLVGDLRYVARGEYAAFAQDESEEERERWFRIYLSQQSSFGSPDQTELRVRFDRDRPPGFFGHRQAFSAEGKYGQWLLEKPLVVVVNGNAFVHGGLSPLVAELGLDGLNETLGSHVSDYVTQLGVLHEAGLIDPTLSFNQHRQKAESLATNTTLSVEVQGALQKIIDLRGSDVHNNNGPLWYRGNVGCSTLVEGDRLTEALRAIGAERVVIGHTPTQSREVLARLDGRVIEIDTGMLQPYYKGSGHALIIEDGELWVASEHTPDLNRVVQHQRRVGYRPEELSGANLEYLLTHGEILSSTTDGAGRKIVVVSDNGATISAVFTEDRNRRGLNPELAAYRLDRLLNLDMVPVTVAREVDGEKGSLQFAPEHTRTEQSRSHSGGGAEAWCPLREQWRAMYIFDSLAYNRGRGPTNTLYNLENWQLILNGHDEAFGAERLSSRYLEEAPLNINSYWERALSSLDDETLETNLGDVLGKRRVNALAIRRDQLLEIGN